MSATDPRARLEEIKARADDCQTYKFGMRNADRLAQEDAPAMAAALTAVLDLCRDMHAAYERDPHQDAIAYEIERAITDALGGTP